MTQDLIGRPCGVLQSMDGKDIAAPSADVRQSRNDASVADRKFHLVLDLDKTLIKSLQWHTITAKTRSGFPPISTTRAVLNCGKEIVLRPHVRHFLLEMRKLYHIHISSHGTTQYVLECLEFLAHGDPTTRDELKEVFQSALTLCCRGRATLPPHNGKRFVHQNLPPASTVAVDDNPHLWTYSQSQTFSVPPWDPSVETADSCDDVLQGLGEVLQQLHQQVVDSGVSFAAAVGEAMEKHQWVTPYDSPAESVMLATEPTKEHKVPWVADPITTDEKDVKIGPEDDEDDESVLHSPPGSIEDLDVFATYGYTYQETCAITCELCIFAPKT
eukprot:TRINITY_DN60527_c0_g1_i2.p1 TRINITY_DN60527_c0_g1~~TRINITY_DN60527_c0_g1_i2.p1  ORF type:complete len:329 (+),score=17.34 TRINITY_DN60527_c0_g1_i2:233-1219(+)